jgi:hypothetical protein
MIIGGAPNLSRSFASGAAAQELFDTPSRRRLVGCPLMSSDKPRAQELAAALEAQVATIFERCRELHAFSVAERLVYENAEEGVREWELYVCAIAAYPALASSESESVTGQISGALAELCNECPQAAELLPGRTFARAWH